MSKWQFDSSTRQQDQLDRNTLSKIIAVFFKNVVTKTQLTQPFVDKRSMN